MPPSRAANSGGPGSSQAADRAFASARIIPFVIQLLCRRIVSGSKQASHRASWIDTQYWEGVRIMTNALNQFTMEISIDRDAYGDPVVYVDDKNRAGRTYTFGDFAEACDALDDWKQIAQVIVPQEGVWRHTAGFQTDLKGRRDRKTEHEKLAQRLARIRAGLDLSARQRYQFEGEDLVQFNLQIEDTRRMTVSALKAALKREDMTVVGARAKAKAKSEAKAAIRANYRAAKATEKALVVSLATEQGKAEASRTIVVNAIEDMGKSVAQAVEEPVAVEA